MLQTSISPDPSDIQAALRAFLVSVLPSDVAVISGQVNRVSEPSVGSFCVMTPIRYARLETNLDAYADVKFTGLIQALNMTVSAVQFGTILPGAYIFGDGIPLGTYIVNQVNGQTGGTGNYTIGPAQIQGGSQTISAGAMSLVQGAETVIRLDFHSADLTAGDMAQMVSTSLRDEFATSFFSALPSPQNSVVPLLGDDPHQMPFLNAEQQFEWMWTLEARLQANQTVSVPLEFFDSAAITPYAVEGTSIVIGKTSIAP